LNELAVGADSAPGKFGAIAILALNTAVSLTNWRRVMI